MRPTANHGPLPRLKPQPLHITGMITKRTRVREWRGAKLEEVRSLQMDAENEAKFEAALLQKHPEDFRPTFLHPEWCKGLVSTVKFTH